MNKETYWNTQGKYQQFILPLEALVPVEGSVQNPRKNKALEKFRRASNCYYDLYNNGLYNRKAEFRRVFGLTSSAFQCGFGHFTQSLYDRCEVAMDAIVLEAAIEQNLIQKSA